MAKPSIDRSIDVPGELIKELLTPSEVRMVKQRLHIINLLEEGLTIRKIAEKAQVGTDTVVRIARMAEKKEVRKLLESNNVFRSNQNKKIKSKTPWIFGKTD